MDISEESLALHYKLRGKLEVVSRYPIQTQKDLSQEKLVITVAFGVVRSNSITFSVLPFGPLTLLSTQFSFRL